MGIYCMVIEVEEFISEVKNDLGGRLTSEDAIIAVFAYWDGKSQEMLL